MNRARWLAAIVMTFGISPVAQAQTPTLTDYHNAFRLLVQQPATLEGAGQTIVTMHVMETKSCQSWVRVQRLSPVRGAVPVVSAYHLRWNRMPKVANDGLKFIVTDTAPGSREATLYLHNKEHVPIMTRVIAELRKACEGKPDEPSIRPANAAQLERNLPSLTRTIVTEFRGRPSLCRAVGIPQLELLRDEEAHVTIYSAKGPKANLSFESDGGAFETGDADFHLEVPGTRASEGLATVPAKSVFTSTNSNMQVTVPGEWGGDSYFFYMNDDRHLFNLLRAGGVINVTVPLPRGGTVSTSMDVTQDFPALVRMTGLGC